MISSRNLIVVGLAALFLIGCVTGGGKARNVRVKVSANEQTDFTLAYQFRDFGASVSANTTGQGWDVVLDVPFGYGNCEITKLKPAVELKVAIVEDRTEVFRTVLEPGTQSVRLVRDPKGWRRED